MSEVVARVEVLERQMAQALALRDAVVDLGVRVTALERTVHDGFSAIHAELRGLQGGHQELRGNAQQLRTEFQQLRGEVQELRGEVQQLRGEVREVRAEVEALRRHMLVLHEDLVERIKVLGEGRSRRRRH